MPPVGAGDGRSTWWWVPPCRSKGMVHCVNWVVVSNCYLWFLCPKYFRMRQEKSSAESRVTQSKEDIGIGEEKKYRKGYVVRSRKDTAYLPYWC